jgi:hypothetical protein
LHVGRIARDYDADGNVTINGEIGGVEGAAAWIEAHVAPQLMLKLRLERLDVNARR